MPTVPFYVNRGGGPTTWIKRCQDRFAFSLYPDDHGVLYRCTRGFRLTSACQLMKVIVQFFTSVKYGKLYRLCAYGAVLFKSDIITPLPRQWSRPPARHKFVVQFILVYNDSFLNFQLHCCQKNINTVSMKPTQARRDKLRNLWSNPNTTVSLVQLLGYAFLAKE